MIGAGTVMASAEAFTGGGPGGNVEAGTGVGSGTGSAGAFSGAGGAGAAPGREPKANGDDSGMWNAVGAKATASS